MAGRLLDDGDVAIMMVEAGGTETAWPSYEDGAPKVDRRGPGRRPRGVQDLDPESIEVQLELIEAAGGRQAHAWPSPS